MSDLVNTVLVQDSRISQISDKINYGVFKGASQISQQQYQAQTSSASQAVWNIQVPSQNTLIDKRLLYRSTQTIAIPLTSTAAPGNVDFATLSTPAQQDATLAAISYGRAASLAAYPLHQLMNVVTATINSTAVTVNMADVLPFMLKMLDNRQLRAYNSYAPTAVDVYGDYNDQIGANNSTFANFSDSADQDIVGNGAWQIDSAVWYDANNNAPLPNATPVAVGTNVYLRITFTSTEALMISPFTFAHLPFQNGALYGITALNFNMTKQANGNRVWRSASNTGGPWNPRANMDVIVMNPATTQASVEQLWLTFMIAHPSSLLPQQNVSNYYELPRFVNSVGVSGAGSLPVGVTSGLQSQSLQFNYVPDMVMIGVRKRQRYCTDADAFLPITHVSVNFNSVVGILSSTSEQTLYQMAKDNGYSGSYLEFRGNAYGASAGTDQTVRTQGGFLVLKFGRDINLPDDYMAPGLLGNFVFQFTYSLRNPGAAALDGSDYELVIIPMNSGVFVTNNGSSVAYTAILSKEKVLQTSEQNVYTEGDVQRMVGGSFWGSLKNIASSIKDVALPIASIAKPILGSMADPRAQAAAQVMGALGAGAGGGISGGRKHRDMRL